MPADNRSIIFKDAEAAVEYASKYCVCEFKQGVSLIAVVLDAKSLFQADQSVKREEDGSQLAIIKVSSNDLSSDFVIPAWTIGSGGGDLCAGDLVSWHIFQFDANIAKNSLDKRFGWIGFITSKLTLNFHLEKGWQVDTSFEDEV